MTTVAEVLDQAADLIEHRGHAHDMYQAPSGALCARGAVRMAVFGGVCFPDHPDDAAVSLYYAACRSLGAVVDVPITTWNDGHTQAEVIGGLRRAARLARDAVKL
jgi:hypothetical protein